LKTLGIILAGGKSSRLYPTTLAVTKQLLPIYDKPLIYYPLSTLMLAGIKDILIITSSEEKDIFQRLFSFNSNHLGINLSFATQHEPKGIAQAFQIAEFHYGPEIKKFNRTCLILGDNFFYGSGLTGKLRKANSSKSPVVFAIKVKDPERFGVVEVKPFDNDFYESVSIEEKPKNPKSNLAVTGLYFYPQSVYDYASDLKPSSRGELEITDINKIYNQKGDLRVIQMLRGMTWFDTGTFASMMEASQFVQTIQTTQNILIGSPHEIAYNNKWISDYQLLEFAKNCKNDYGNYLKSIQGESV
jgi:glucose-1-phosphate thymidylyltransferase